MDRTPEAYVWSSYGHNAWGDNSWITPHDEYLYLGTTKAKRCYQYRELFKHHFDMRDIHRIREAAHCCQPVGDDKFKQAIENQFHEGR